MRTFGIALSIIFRSCGNLNRAEFVPHVFCVDQGLHAFFLLSGLLLRTHHDVVVVLHLAEARENRDSDVTVALDAVDRECLRHLTNKLIYLPILSAFSW